MIIIVIIFIITITIMVFTISAGASDSSQELPGAANASKPNQKLCFPRRTKQVGFVLKIPSLNYNMTISRYSGYVYDAVWLYAKVLDNLIKKDKSFVQVRFFTFTFSFFLVSCEDNSLSIAKPLPLQLILLLFLKESCKVERLELVSILVSILYHQS